MPRVASSRSCFTCRKRKLKCDEKLPVCNRCLKAGRLCDRTSKLFIKNLAPVDFVDKDSGPQELLKTPHIAHLFHVYLKDLAPWYDLTDSACCFTREVPRHALNSQLLFSAIIAFSACYLARKLGSSYDVAETYHRKCMKLLIELSPQDEIARNGIALAATCLLRSYEILSEVEDPNRHLFGASTLLPRDTPTLNDQSLLAAGFWNYLREDITYSLIHDCPLKINVGEALPGHVTAENLANAMTLLVARAINVHFGQPGNVHELTFIENDVAECWTKHKPLPFSHYQLPIEDFPTIKLLTDSQVAAHHYYRVLRCILDHKDRADLAAEVCGLAMSSLSNAVTVNAYGPICFTGRWLESSSQRDTLLQWLSESKTQTSWAVEQILTTLRKAWDLSTT